MKQVTKLRFNQILLCCLLLGTAISAAQAICDFKRGVLLSNPVLDFGQLVAVQRAQLKSSNKPMLNVHA